MMKKIIFISLLTSTLFADQASVISDFHLENSVLEVDNELGFGKKSTYSLIFAKHELTSSDQSLHFYYGAKMGIINEEHTADNGFGLPLNDISAYYAAAVGMEYDLSQEGILLAEAIRSEDQLYQRSESKLQVTYTYNY